MQTIIGKLNDFQTEKLLSGLENYFHTEGDTEQVPISLESHKKLLLLNPFSLGTTFSDDGELVASVATFPTTKESMDLFMKGKITEKELFDKTNTEDKFEALYLMSAFVVPQFRRQGIAMQLSKEVVSKIDPESKMTLFAWPTSQDGEVYIKIFEKEISRSINYRPN